MNKVVQLEDHVRPSVRLQLAHREEVVKCMSQHLVAAVLHDGLNTASDIDVIQCLLNTPERFQSRVVLNHLDDALFECKQILIAKEIGAG